jgi:bifunctional DNA primase/polymerase-like protein
VPIERECRPGNTTETANPDKTPRRVNNTHISGYAYDQLPSGYGAASEIYWQRGWRGILPIPARAKKYPPTGYTGHDGIDPSYADITAWGEDRPGDNIALRLPVDVVGIDVDAYGTKTGAATLAEAERHWGKLPPTYRTTSRTDGASGIKLFRVPGATKFADLGGDVETVQHTHRYAMVWPSIHPSGWQYQWICEIDGNVMDYPPSPDDLPELPSAWVDALKIQPAQHDSTANAAEMPYNIADALTEGQPSARVVARLTEAMGALL